MHFQSEERTNQIVIIRTCVIGGISLLLMLFLSVKSVVPMIEKDLLQKVSMQLIDSRLNNILVSVRGQDIYLEGLVNEHTRSQALHIADEVYGVRKVHDHFTLVTKNEPN